MFSLGDCFPPKHRKDHATRSLRPRCILKFLYKEAQPTPKDKRFLIIGENSTNIGCLIINSEINTNVYRPGTPDYDLQIKINNFYGCEYLDRDSYVDCTFLLEWKKCEIEPKITECPERSLGYICEEHWDTIIEAVRNRNRISLKKKKDYGII
jgi:hypothetical protein